MYVCVFVMYASKYNISSQCKHVLNLEVEKSFLPRSAFSFVDWGVSLPSLESVLTISAGLAGMKSPGIYLYAMFTVWVMIPHYHPCFHGSELKFSLLSSKHFTYWSVSPAGRKKLVHCKHHVESFIYVLYIWGFANQINSYIPCILY